MLGLAMIKAKAAAVSSADALELDARRAAVVALRQSGSVDAEDVRRLRRDIFADGAVSRDEADALFALDMSKCQRCPEWTAFFVESILDHVVWQARPTGVVNESQGEWLIAMADRCNSPSALGALANVAAEAHRLPLWFVAAVRARLARSGVPVSLGLVA